MEELRCEGTMAYRPSLYTTMTPWDRRSHTTQKGRSYRIIATLALMHAFCVWPDKESVLQGQWNSEPEHRALWEGLNTDCNVLYRRLANHMIAS